MRRFTIAFITGILVLLAADIPIKSPFAQGTSAAGKASEIEYEVLAPWAEIDPTPVRIISPRLDTLAGRKIGLFANIKPAARPILAEVEKNLKTRFPDVQISVFQAKQWNQQQADRPRFEAWVKGVDAAVVAVGD
jgi:hypothetical protein